MREVIEDFCVCVCVCVCVKISSESSVMSPEMHGGRFRADFCSDAARRGADQELEQQGRDR